MKLAQVCLRFDAPGGVETVVRELSTRLRREGEEVEVFASDLYDESHWIRRNDYATEVDGVPVHRFPVFKRLVPGLTMPLQAGLISALVASRPELIHAHSHRYGHVLQAAAVAHRLGIPLVVTPHYHPADRREPPLKRGLLRGQDFLFGATAYRQAAAVIALTEQERALLTEFAPASRLRVIPDGVDLDSWRNRDESPPGPGDPALPDRYLLYVGRIAANKGLDVLVEALARIPVRDRPRLVLMGRDWGQRPALEVQAGRLGVSADLVWLGHVADPRTYRAIFRRATLFVLPSEWEAFGLVLLEAMGAGVPIVATAVGGVPEVLDRGKAGLLVSYGDPGALAGAIQQLLASPERCRALAQHASNWVEQYSWERVVARYRLLYRELAG